ncbi:AAA family ATPase [Bacillus cereus group sp. BfR-BA-01361]|uniref:AAA family ATPase n=1 Tax=Bacillus cereus group sp. BfR-BA-01361 TaxID=2920322 RepID=UPI001F55BAC9|nr:AAA family ATPase [Bacillus cereus group sp. BfR-BA-01361]
MFIEAIKIKILAKSGKKYGRYLNFLVEDEISEINMIFGKNTLGKSTLIESIIYGLNGEAVYGKKQREIINFKLLLKKFMDEKLEHAEVYLQLQSNGKRVVILRDAVEVNEPVIVFKNIFLEEYDTGKTLDDRAKEKEFYKINKDKNIIGNQTYQEFLFSFLGIEPIRKVSENIEAGDNGKEERLIFYIQNLLPLCVIPQEAWTDIQATNPKYEIADIKKTAFEFLLDLSNTDVAKYRHSLEYFNAQLRGKMNSLKDLQEVIQLLDKDSVAQIDDEIKVKKNDIIAFQKKISEMEKGNRVVDNVLKEIRSKYRKISMIAKRHEDSLELLEAEISQYQYYITKIESDIEKNDKLKTAKKLIGILPIETCPRCLNDIEIEEKEELATGHCDLCGSELQSLKNTVQTLHYLQDELKDFKRLMWRKEEAKKEISNKLFLARLELKNLRETMDDYEDQLKPQSLEQYNYFSREIGRIENSIKELEKDKEVLKKYEILIKEKDKVAERIKELRQKIKAAKASENLDNEKLETFESEFKDMLFKLDFLKDGFDTAKVESLDKSIKEKGKKNISVIGRIYEQIVIDADDYYPKIDGVNLYNITSSSGLIRIILSYYLALLKTSLIYKKSTNHPCLLILDEPRQQNLDFDTFNHFLEQLYELKKDYPEQFQVILASSVKGNILDGDIRLFLSKVNNKLIKQIIE